ncbi:MAG: M23 family metallopeptidase [Candidatus Desulforudis sp.]|nr:M23 family metallopeptidase [Desulforudis sp.]
MRLFTRVKRLDWPLPPQASRRQGTSPRRWLFRLTVVTLVFVAFLAIRQSESPWGVQVRQGLQYVLTTDWNYQPVVDRVVRLGLQTVSVDIPFLDTRPHGPDADTEMVTVQMEDLVLPVSGTVVREFGWITDAEEGRERFHPGVDLAAPAGTPVRAVMSGVVAQVGENPTYGPYVLMEHGPETYTLYAQLENIRVAKDDRVEQGRILAEVGKKGDFPGPGVHFELREKGELVDPLTRLAFPENRS